MLTSPKRFSFAPPGLMTAGDGLGRTARSTQGQRRQPLDVGGRLRCLGAAPDSCRLAQVGATVAVGLLEGNQNVNWPLVVRVMAGWAVTLFVVGGTSAMLFAQGAYAPSKLNLRQLLEYQRGIEGNVADMVYVLEQPFFTHSPNGDLITAALGNISQALFEVSDTQNVYAVQELTLLNYTLNTYMLATTPLEQLEVVSYRFGVETMAPPNGTDPSADTLHYYT